MDKSMILSEFCYHESPIIYEGVSNNNEIIVEANSKATGTINIREDGECITWCLFRSRESYPDVPRPLCIQVGQGTRFSQDSMRPMSSSSSPEPYGTSFDTYGRYTQRGRHIKPLDEHEHQGRLKWQAEKSIKYDMEKVIEDSAVVDEEKHKQLVFHCIRNHILKYQKAYQILQDDAEYNKLRGEMFSTDYSVLDLYFSVNRIAPSGIADWFDEASLGGGVLAPSIRIIILSRISNSRYTFLALLICKRRQTCVRKIHSSFEHPPMSFFMFEEEFEGKADSLTDHGQNIGRDHHAEKQESCETIGVYAMEKEESCSQSRKRRSKK
ncbi:hypothetical protein RHSIM_RhsimUnG0003200 [Rhododendron simsii]|uniref:Uncharacterized protein n=1 Tax=Rhododendron simsii TaxID=118357 RepID=A0A834FXA2_RHOSS|nr:hypothetical protein RHSIM_RhsimUnG0003200 [Rhododendron simsii]